MFSKPVFVGYDFKRRENGVDVIVEIDEDDYTENLPLCVVLLCCNLGLNFCSLAAVFHQFLQFSPYE